MDPEAWRPAPHLPLGRGKSGTQSRSPDPAPVGAGSGGQGKGGGWGGWPGRQGGGGGCVGGSRRRVGAGAWEQALQPREEPPLKKKVTLPGRLSKFLMIKEKNHKTVLLLLTSYFKMLFFPISFPRTQLPGFSLVCPPAPPFAVMEPLHRTASDRSCGPPLGPPHGPPGAGSPVAGPGDPLEAGAGWRGMQAASAARRAQLTAPTGINYF